ncbi:phage portal protein [Pukyongiella litopenaei]|uniref:Phage portal protein n=2 Tax=Pukyongiella litopenaei TaxID=2605946 RepID=A0A2S0MUN3_9RHOB|nr:phage portal protein [Pukyongiella litopenaei]
MVSESSALALSAVWGCTNLLAGTIGSLPLSVYREKNGARYEDREHPLFRVLHDRPNYDQTAVDFLEFMAASVELWGNFYAEIDRGSAGRVSALTPVRPEQMVTRRLDTGEIEYRWTYNGRQKVKRDREILHVRGFGGCPLGGLSTLQVGRNVFGSAQAVDRAAASMFRNGMRPAGAMIFESYLTPEQREIAETRLVEKYAGAMNSGRPMVLEGGTKWQQFALNPEDAQMLESRRFTVEEICRMFGVPPHMVGHTENSTSWGTGLEQQTLGFQKFTLRRRLRRIEQALEQQLLEPADRAAGVSISFNVEGLLRGDSAGRAAFYQTMVSLGLMTINEGRARENLPPVAGGDVPRIQMQNQPITEAGNDNAS